MATHKAFLAGVNNYQSVSDLRGCVSDVDKMERLLTESFDFPAHNIRRLTDEQVIKRNVLNELDWLLGGAQAGDQLVLFFAGHGTQVLDQDGDEEDGVDEVLCLWDMDFNNPESYLSDDDIHTFTQRLPDDVALTIIFDNCHSGTATRMLLTPETSRSLDLPPNKTPLVDLSVTMARAGETGTMRSLAPQKAIKRVLTPTNEAERRQTVLARYIEPPRKVQEVMFKHGRRSGVARGREESALNHVFFAASQANQTSADAFINGGYHGAFTYHFCQAAKRDGVDVQKLIRTVRSSLKKANFDQNPQLEPSTAAGALFTANGNHGSKVPKPIAKPVSAAPGAAVPPARTNQTDQALYLNIVELLQQIVERLEPQPGAGGQRETITGQRALVYVHGICTHKPGYSDPWFNALTPFLSSDLRTQLQNHRREVLWSDLVSNVRAISRDLSPDAPQNLVTAQERREQEFTEMLRDVVEDRVQREALKQLPKQRDFTPRSQDLAVSRGALERIGLSCLDDFGKYLLRNVVRRAVQKRFFDVALPLLEGGAQIDIVSHSWGTVVAYEALRQLDGRELPGGVRNLFTVGSALSIVPVKRQLETPDLSKPRCVRRWINLDADGDFVGGGLKTLGYGVDEEFLNLEPVGCGAFLLNPACPHSSYFKPENQAVNQAIFARYMDS
jgi:hypothetical protein